jgi:hypothetical protein
MYQFNPVHDHLDVSIPKAGWSMRGKPEVCQDETDVISREYDNAGQKLVNMVDMCCYIWRVHIQSGRPDAGGAVILPIRQIRLIRPIGRIRRIGPRPLSGILSANLLNMKVPLPP